mmetsp:Transcript_124981/g.186668  ORF Transcript_124981/g.186668 Transcript_124981/m.186668 type:complete len:188 (+) Transcript_124981:1-564(+)
MKVVSFLCFFACVSLAIATLCPPLNIEQNTLLHTKVAENLYSELDYHYTSIGSSNPGNSYYANGFTCVTAANGTVKPSPCNEVEFPLCMGRIEIDMGCRDIACCNHLNLKAALRVPIVTGVAGSYNYYMKFFNQQNATIPCSQFTSNTEDYCIQFADYAASSDPVTCNFLETVYERQGSDAMAFDLF